MYVSFISDITHVLILYFFIDNVTRRTAIVGQPMERELGLMALRWTLEELWVATVLGISEPTQSSYIWKLVHPI